MSTGLEVVLLVLFYQSNIALIGERILARIGSYFLFRKCGVTPWHALIPYYEVYGMARCANHEQEGRLLFVLNAATVLVTIGNLFIPEDSRLLLFQLVIVLVLEMVNFVYAIRMYMGLCDIFGRSRAWVLGFLLIDGITCLIFGLSKKFQPQFKVQDVENEVSRFFSNKEVGVMEEGLTVNLEERTASDMFRKKYLLRDVHMYIKPGHMVLLLGGSGAGKTTLVNAINGYEKAKAKVFLNGGDVYGQYKHMQYQIGFVPQMDLMRGSDTVYHTLCDAAALRLPKEFSVAERHRRVNEVMEIFGLTSLKDSLVSKLSGGQRKRLSISMEFISNPSLFILDEPDSGLDGIMARELMKQLRGIADQGKIVLVITHTPDRVIDLFDDVIVLAKDSNKTGRLAFYGPIDEARAFFQRDTMEDIVRSINGKNEGGEGRADELIMKYAEVQHG